jgi:glutathione synthase/RimK-type ligase-like ATP-grasp enzyme
VSARRPVVVVGSAEDHHAKAVLDGVVARGVRAILLDPLRFPGSHRLSLGSPHAAMELDGVRIGEPAAVYLRSLYLSPIAFGVDVETEMQADWRRTLVVFREKSEFLVSVLRRWEALGIPIYNPLTASDALRKPFQIATLEAAGLPVPRTLWTNDPDAVRRFAEGRAIVYKPLAGGAATRVLEAKDLTEDRLARLANSPVTFQELLPGKDLRVYVLDDEVIAAYEIDASEVDFRGHEQSIVAFRPDAALAALCVRAARVLSLRFSGMDVKADADGRPRFLELNASPMFIGFDQRAGTDVLGALVARLVAHAGSA